MAEVYPSDSDLLNLTSDSETGVEYIPTGTAPYYLEFRKLLYRLLLSMRRANDLRVYDEGDLDVGVKAGKFWLGTELISYAGSSGNTLADDKTNIYLYLDSSGTLVTNEYNDFPEMATTPHVRLAVITTSGGDIESIEDHREGNNVCVPYASGGVFTTIESHTGDDIIDPTESGSIHTNLGATVDVSFELPTPTPVGTVLTFAVQAAHSLQLDPVGQTILDDSGQTPGYLKQSSTIGASITLVSDENNDWVTVAKNGTWTESI